jgi:hypothetical protein
MRGTNYNMKYVCNIYNSVDFNCHEVFAVFIERRQKNDGKIMRTVSPVVTSLFFPPYRNLPVCRTSRR